MISYKKYDEKNHCEEAWLDSTMIVYTKMVEDEYENKGDLYVVFKNGTMYKYIGVSLSDYVVFIGGGTDGSQGKTLNKVIKAKYEVEKCENANLDELEKRMKGLSEKDREDEARKLKTYFVFGYRDIYNEEFEAYYQPALAACYEDAYFVVGDKNGVDFKTQNFLLDVLRVDPERITVYHAGDSPMNKNIRITNVIGGFETDEDADKAMTKASVKDVGFVRDESETTFVSKNILRRYKF